MERVDSAFTDRVLSESLFDRISNILDQARRNVVKTVNNQMVIAYWLIGREIVQEIQKGEGRAEYGSKVIENLSKQLKSKYGRGFSVTNLRYFRMFFSIYSERVPEIRQIRSGESEKKEGSSLQLEILKNLSIAVETTKEKIGFSPFLGWSHYQALLSVENPNERLFYEIESEKDGWDVEHLKRQIHTFLFARLLKSQDKVEVMQLAQEGHVINKPADLIKDPYILDFLGIPESRTIHESEIESAIIENLQQFLLELGKGFAFVCRQRRMQFDNHFFYIDLVFYNCILKCYLLIDLKVGELTHQDVGQMDSYVRMFDDKYLTEGDNPTIGLILCSKNNETIVKYSVLKDSQQIFASKYILYLPTEEELARELDRERKMIEDKFKMEDFKKAKKKKPKNENKNE